MFAVIRTGGKQYKVAKDDVIAVEKLAGEPGATAGRRRAVAAVLGFYASALSQGFRR